MTKSTNGKVRRTWNALWILTVIALGIYFTVTAFRAHNTGQAVFAIVFFGGILILDRAVIAWRNRADRRERK